MDAVQLLLSVAGILTGGYILVTRMDPLSIGDYAFAYVIHWLSLGSGCMIGGWLSLGEGFSFSYVALLVGTLCYLCYQRGATKPGQAWSPPEHSRVRHE